MQRLANAQGIKAAPVNPVAQSVFSSLGGNFKGEKKQVQRGE